MARVHKCSVCGATTAETFKAGGRLSDYDRNGIMQCDLPRGAGFGGHARASADAKKLAKKVHKAIHPLEHETTRKNAIPLSDLTPQQRKQRKADLLKKKLARMQKASEKEQPAGFEKVKRDFEWSPNPSMLY